MDYIPLKSNTPANRSDNLGRKRKIPNKLRSIKSPRDNQLVKRIQQVLGESIPKSVDSSNVVTDLKKFFPEYRRKKARDFNFAVTNALTFLKSKTEEQQKDEDSDGDTDFSDIVMEYSDSNLINQSISDMYKNSPKPERLGNAKNDNSAQMTGKEEKLEEDNIPSKKARKSSSQENTRAKRKHEVQLQETQVSFENIGGVDKIIEDMFELLVQVRHPEIYEHLGLVPPRGFLLHGPPGSGKTLLASAIAGELQLPMLKVAATELVKGVSGESEEKIREIFDQALGSTPCLLFIDEIDAITPKRETAQREMERRIVAQLLTCLDELSQKPASTKLIVIGATNRADSLDPALRRAGRFDNEICLSIPDEEARIKILKVCCKNLNLESNFNFQDLAHRTPGYVGADLMALTRKAGACAVKRILDDSTCNSVSTEKKKTYSPWFIKLQEPTPSVKDYLKTSLTEEDFLVALKIVQPSSKREGFATVPDVTWDDVGALKNIREELQMAILAPVSHRTTFESLGLPTSSGILLCGPPGCGKTLLAKAIANESGLNFISVKGPELLNMYVGESERAVRQCFQRARNASPCVIFFDELDALCPRRTKDTAVSGASDRVVNQLLTEMDGMDSRKQVFILAATNRPDIIDPAILRPGRLDKVLYIGLPLPEDRVDILRTVTKNGTKPPLEEDVILEDLGRDARCESFTGADLAALVREASSLAIKQAMQHTDQSELHNLKVKQCHFQEAFKKMRPSISPQDQRIYEKMKSKSSVTSSHL